jgi:uncharacterized protein (DUF849 family)
MVSDFEAGFVLNLAPTGMIPTSKMTPHVPLSPQAVAKDVRDALELGLTFLHLHARDGNERPTSSPEIYAQFIAAVREVSPELVICVSCSGRQDPAFEPRAAVLDLEEERKPDMASLTLSSLNFPRTASVNAPDTVVRLAERMRERGIKPELEVFDLGMMNVAHYLVSKGHLEPPYYFNFILGNLASAQVDPLHLGILLRELPEDSLWSAGGIGDGQVRANAMALAHGGGVRVGLEDTIWFDADRKRLATNRDLLVRVTQLAQHLGRRPLTPLEFRRRLALA